MGHAQIDGEDIQLEVTLRPLHKTTKTQQRSYGNRSKFNIVMLER